VVHSAERQVNETVSEVAPTHGVIRFDAFEVDFRKGEVRKHGYKVRLQDQPFRILQILLEHPGELVTREEIQRRIWPADTFVDFEKGLNNAIRKLRDALGDSAEEPRFIETHSGRGYSFIGTVTATDGASQKGKAVRPVEVRVPAPSRSLYPRVAFGAVVVLVLVATLFGFDVGGVREHWLARASSPAIHSLAVLPLANLSNDPSQEYFSDGMTDALITDLAQISSLKIISRTSTMQYKQTRKSLPEIARELNVDGIIEGTVQRSGDRVRITAQLIAGTSDKHLWTDSYERDVRDVFALERDVTADVARQIQAHVSTQNQSPTAAHQATNLKALEAYLQGKYHLDREGRGGGDEESRRAAEYFQQAIDADPNFAPAFVGMSQAHGGLLIGSAEDITVSKKYAERAVELDPSYPDARAWLGTLKWQPYLDWQGAEREFRLAIALDPNNANAHDALGQLLNDIGRLDEGLRESQRAQELDPNQDHLSDALWRRRDYDGALTIERMMLNNHPNDGYLHLSLFQSYAQMGMKKEAIEELEKVWRLFGFAEVATHMAQAYDVTGYQGAIRQCAQDTEQLQATNRVFLPANLADMYAILGEKDRAFYWLREANEHREIASVDPGVSLVKTDPLLDSLRSDPRYKELLQRAGLPP